MVANVTEGGRYCKEEVELLLKAHIENLLDLGWKKENIDILSNIDFSFMDVSTRKIKLNDFCLKGSKMFGLSWLIENNLFNDIIHASDLDAWQNVWFEPPKFKDVGITTYSRPKLNGGSSFWKPTSIDIIDKIINTITETKAEREEPTLNLILKSKEYRDRVTIINNTFNVGCSGFIPRYQRSEKPIKVCHFNVRNSIAWETHTLDRNGINEIAVDRRLERLIRKYYTDLPIKLSKKGERRRKEIIEERIKNPKK